MTKGALSGLNVVVRHKTFSRALLEKLATTSASLVGNSRLIRAELEQTQGPPRAG